MVLLLSLALCATVSCVTSTPADVNTGSGPQNVHVVDVRGKPDETFGVFVGPMQYVSDDFEVVLDAGDSLRVEEVDAQTVHVTLDREGEPPESFDVITEEGKAPQYADGFVPFDEPQLGCVETVEQAAAYWSTLPDPDNESISRNIFEILDDAQGTCEGYEEILDFLSSDESAARYWANLLGPDLSGSPTELAPTVAHNVVNQWNRK